MRTILTIILSLIIVSVALGQSPKHYSKSKPKPKVQKRHRNPQYKHRRSPQYKHRRSPQYKHRRSPQYKHRRSSQCPYHLVPVPPQYYAPHHFAPPQLPPKPDFVTPLRDGAWYLNYKLNKMLWYNRYWRYRRLEGLIGPPYKKPEPKTDNKEN